MKQIFNLIAVLLLLSRLSHAQSTFSFTISILDSAYVPTVTQSGNQLSISFQQSALNDIVSQYTITTFQKAYPSSRLQHLRQIYFISADSSLLMDNLEQAYPDVFSGATAYNEPVWVFSPNDYGREFGGRQEHLDYIHAKEAWDVDQGDSSIVIGVTDEWVNRSHPDLSGKFTNQYVNPMTNVSGISHSHGTAVAGLIAGQTHNNEGLASIGFKCSISDAPMSDSNILKMSVDGIRIVNASWIGSIPHQSVLDFTGHASKVELYNEIYENGTILVAGAGNSGLKGHTAYGGVTEFQFPASFDNVISVSSVGHLNTPILPYDSANHEENVKDYHLSYLPGFGYQSMTHNSRVDMCAPGFNLKSTVVDRFIPPNSLTILNYDSTLTGSSGSAPLVSGTVGLMLHAKPCLSPYQVEYLLKRTAKKIDTVPANASFVGQLGAGSLNSFKAVDSAKKYNCNNPSTTTMYIDGVEISTLCAPRSPNPVHPVMKVRIANGNPPYSYRWLSITGNKTTLDNPTSGTPAIVSSTGTAVGTDIAHYLLTVTDASPVPKVATTRVKFILKIPTSNFDLAMRDSYYDLLDEPNSQGIVDPRHQNIWESPDLWNRKLKDGVTVPQNIEYFSSGDSNFMYVRVRNVGCVSSPAGAKVKMYWSMASTGEKWDVDWKNKNVRDNTGSSTPGVPGGREITPLNVGISLPSIPVGDSIVVVQAWKPQNPKTYFGSPDSVGVCALARIETSSTSPYGMNTVESFSGSIANNVRNNNNIVTRNMMAANLGRSHARVKYQVLVANTDATNQVFSLQMINDKDIFKHFGGNISDYAYAIIHLGDLYDRWQQGGGIGSFGILDDSAKTITYDPSSPIRLENINIDTGEFFQVEITFCLRDSVYVEFPVSTNFHFRQLRNGENGEEVYGNVSYALSIDADDAIEGGTSRKIYTVARSSTDKYLTYPNPVSRTLSLQYKGAEKVTSKVCVTDILGRVVIQSREVTFESESIHQINMGGLSNGTYLIYVSDNAGANVVHKISKK